MARQSSSDSHSFGSSEPNPGPTFGRGDLDPATLSYMPPPRKASSSRRLPILLGMLVLTCLAVPGIAYFQTASMPASAEASAPVTAPVPAPAPAPITGTASITSVPAGAVVTIDGEPRGVTPLRLSMAPGTYALVLRNGGMSQEVPLTIEANATAEAFADLVPSLAASGRLEITSDPPGANVTVDGTARGTTPLVLAAVPAGQHRVVVSDGTMTVNRTVNVIAGTTVSVATTMTPAGATGGWISVKAPFEMQVLSQGRVVGTTRSDRIMLPVGSHELELVSSAFQFKSPVTVRVQAGRTVEVPVTLPNGSLSVNAVPWAEVWLDGQSLGQTPLGQVAVPIGEHELVWRHPQLGERRQTVRITTHTATRVGVDFNKP